MKNETWTKTNRVLVVIALAIAVVAPISANTFFSVWRPDGEGAGQWLERSGAIMTVFSLLAVSLMEEGMSRLHKVGNLADLETLPMYQSFEKNAYWVKGIALLLTVIGTVIWGYGSVIMSRIG